MGLSSSRDYERELVVCCLSGNNHAWHELINRYEPSLRAYVRRCLGNGSVVGIEVEDIVQAVWHSLLIRNKRRLAGFGPKHKNFAVFVNARALQEIQRQARSSQAHREVPLTAAGVLCDPRADDWLENAWLVEIQERLSPLLREHFLEKHLGDHGGSGGPPLTPGALRQRTHRVTAVVQEVIDDAHMRSEKTLQKPGKATSQIAPLAHVY